eukprot:scaffold53722_cov42-Prasinocladus_malaysianus.AAC.2
MREKGTCIAPLVLYACAVWVRLAGALELSDSPPHSLVEMVCFTNAPCHTVYTDDMHGVLYDQLSAAHPEATVRDVLMECSSCNTTGGKPVACYRLASMINFTFATTLAELGEQLFGLEPSGCGETQTYCWHNISCAYDTVRLDPSRLDGIGT